MGFMETQDVAKRRRLVRASWVSGMKFSAFKLDFGLVEVYIGFFRGPLNETNSQKFALENLDDGFCRHSGFLLGFFLCVNC